MTFSYDLSSEPSDKDWVRLRVGDTSSQSYRLEDEEIEALLAAQGDKYLAAAVAAETIAGSFSASVDKTVGRLSIAKSKASDSYFKLARRLRAEAAMRARPYAAGISVADKTAATVDTDRVPPAFTSGQFDYPAADST